MVNAPFVAAAMSTIAIALAIFFVWAVEQSTPNPSREQRRQRRLRAALGAFGWLALTGVLAASGVFARFELRPPPLMLMMAAILVVSVALGLSRVGAELSQLPLPVLIGWQAFRFPLELVMHEAANVGLMPSVMSYSGRNFDIVSGVSALVLALALARFRVPRGVVIAWQVLASALLLNIMVVAILATPLFHAFGEDQVNTWVAYFPYVWLPAVMVSTAVLGHIVIARRLLAERRSGSLSGAVQVPRPQ
ncbi:MAG: hypothetical protein ACOY0T_22410 [Myxococcota bacterium]